MLFKYVKYWSTNIWLNLITVTVNSHNNINIYIHMLRLVNDYIITQQSTQNIQCKAFYYYWELYKEKQKIQYIEIYQLMATYKFHGKKIRTRS